MCFFCHAVQFGFRDFRLEIRQVGEGGRIYTGYEIDLAQQVGECEADRCGRLPVIISYAFCSCEHQIIVLCADVVVEN